MFYVKLGHPWLKILMQRVMEVCWSVYKYLSTTFVGWYVRKNGLVNGIAARKRACCYLNLIFLKKLWIFVWFRPLGVFLPKLTKTCQRSNSKPVEITAFLLMICSGFWFEVNESCSMILTPASTSQAEVTLNVLLFIRFSIDSWEGIDLSAISRSVVGEEHWSNRARGSWHSD